MEELQASSGEVKEKDETNAGCWHKNCFGVFFHKEVMRLVKEKKKDVCFLFAKYFTYQMAQQTTQGIKQHERQSEI